MATIRDVVQVLGQRDGVDTIVVLGRDGLPIDSFTRNQTDVEGVAALVPSLVNACNALGSSAARGEFHACVSEYAGGLVVIAVITHEAIIAVFSRPEANVGNLLFELRRYRSAIAGLL